MVYKKEEDAARCEECLKIVILDICEDLNALFTKVEDLETTVRIMRMEKKKRPPIVSKGRKKKAIKKKGTPK